MNPLITRLDQLFSENGLLPQADGYEFRPQQLAMAHAIGDALLHQQHLIIEAPTGVGKSLAYLAPAILYALQENRKAIISTHTKNLQEQLVRNDLTIIRSLIGEPFTAAVFKGRKNYLCLSRLNRALQSQRSLFSTEESNELLRLRDWADQSEDGDREHLPFAVSPSVWMQVCSEQGICSTKRCGSDCFFQRAKKKARDAQIVIVNHALFFTLFAIQDDEEFFLFKNDFVIFDEAHTIEQVAGLGIGKSISRAQVQFAIHRLFNPKTKKGLLARIRKKHVRDLCAGAEAETNSFFDSLSAAAGSTKGKSATLRIRSPLPVANTLTGPLHHLQDLCKEFEDDTAAKVDREELLAAKRLLWEADVLVREFLAASDPAMTYWIETSSGRSANLTLHAAPTSIAESVGPRLFKPNTSVILTSATLSVNGSVDYLRNRLGATDAQEMILDTPFDFRQQMRVSLGRDIPPPDQPGYEQALPDWIERSIVRSQGKALVLFTSAALMNRCAAALRETLTSKGFALLVQDGKRPRHELLHSFKEDIHSVLFGLDSFWMGIDVPGEALEHVIITRLPFAVPDHPLVESRMELITRQSGNAFMEYTLPEAVLKFRQGVGRLIRSTNDRGMITILDGRMFTKQYGRVFLRSLPRCPVEIVYGDGRIEEIENSE